MQENQPEISSIKIFIDKFGSTIISAEKIEENSVIFLDPPDNRILTVTEMEKPKTRKDVQRLCGMIS